MIDSITVTPGYDNPADPMNEDCWVYIQIITSDNLLDTIKEVAALLEPLPPDKQTLSPDKPATVPEPIRAIEENVQKLDAYLRQCRVGILHGARPIRGDVLSILRNYVSDIQRGIEHDTALDALLEQPGHDDNQIPF
jgi:hypothetical protein